MRLCFQGRMFIAAALLEGVGVQANDIRDMIKAGLPDADVQVMGEDGTHFEAVIVSPSFAGKRTLERHRMVYATLGAKMGHDIHALSMQTLTPDEHRT